MKIQFLQDVTTPTEFHSKSNLQCFHTRSSNSQHSDISYGCFKLQTCSSFQKYNVYAFYEQGYYGKTATNIW